MSRIFLSHSSHNSAQACALRDWLAQHGWDDVFLDLDPRRGLVAGERWQEALKAAADRCEAVVFLVSPAWAESKWCLAEFLLAKSLGKHVFGVVIEDVERAELPGELVGELQIARLIGAGAWETLETRVPGSDSSVEVRFTKEGLSTLRLGLEKAGIDSRTFKLDLTRPRYVGLRALDTQDAAIFFGRDADIVRGMDLVRRMRGEGRHILVVLGASGSGKSSFVRAGLWPRLCRADREFFTLPVVRPENAALEGQYGLVNCLAAAGSGLKRPRVHWRAMLEEAGGLATALRELLEARYQGDGPSPLPVLIVDQTEELFHADAGAEAGRFLERLAEALRAKALLVIFSIRSDRYGQLQSAPHLENLAQVPYSLPPLAAGALKEVIEGPARREREELGAKALQIDPELTDRLMRDWSGSDALPLLAFTLARLVHDYGGDGRINLAEYKASGGLSGAIEAAVGKALRAAVTAREIGSEPSEQERLMRAAFVPWLVRVDAESRIGQRRVSLFADLPATVRPLVDRLIDAGLLTSDSRRVDGVEAKVVEIAHEALLSQWPLLSRLVEEQRDELAALEQVKRDAGGWTAAGRSDDALLHRGGRLSHAEALLARDEMQAALGADGRDYLRACRQRQIESADRVREQQVRERQQLERTRRAQRWATALLTIVALGIIAAGIGLARIASATAQNRSALLAALAANAYEMGEYDRAIRFALSGMANRDAPLIGFDASAAEAQLARASHRTALRLRLIGHDGQVGGAAFSPDGALVLTASEDRTARLWDASTGRELARLEGHDGPVLSAVFSPDGTRVLTASWDHTARLWDGRTGSSLAKLEGHEAPVLSAAFSSDGIRVLTASEDHTARLWDARTGRPLATLEGHEAPVLSAAFSPDGTRAVTASRDRTARLWDGRTGSPLTALEGHEAPVLSAAFSPAGNHILTASEDSTARLWDARTGSPLATFGHITPVLVAAFSPAGTLVLTASLDSTARLWDGRTGSPLATLEGHERPIVSAAFSPDGARILTASSDRTARLWEARTGSPLATLEGHDASVVSAAFSPDGTRVLTASWDRTARLWEARIGSPLATLKGGESVVFDVAFGAVVKATFSAAFSPDGTRALTASADHTARLWDARTGSPLATLEGHDGSVLGAAFSPDGTRVLTASADHTARLWDTRTGSPLATLKGHEGPVVSSALSPDGTRALTASEDQTARLWDGRTGNPLTTLEGHDGPVLSAAFSLDGTRVLTASWDHTARLWDGRTGSPLATLEGHAAPVLSAAFSPDGTHVLTASQDSTARLWDVRTGSPLTTLEGHERPIVSAAFSTDGTCVLTASWDSTARLWDARTGSPLVTLEGHVGQVVNAAFNTSGTRVLTASKDHTARLWDVRTGSPLATLEGSRGPFFSAAFSTDGSRVLTASPDSTARLWDTRLLAALGAQDLVAAACREVLSVDVNAEPFPAELSRLSQRELQLAPVLDPAIDGDACRPATSWQRLKGLLGWR